MSEVVHYSGELELIQTIGPVDLELAAKIALEENNIVKLDSYETYLECLRDNLSDKYVVAKDNLFKIVQKKRVDDDDEFFHSAFLENGNIWFNMRYYNWGCGFDEAIWYALGKG